MKTINRLAFLIVYIVILTCTTSCEDFIERNLEKKSVTVLAPYDGFLSNGASVTFWWEELKGAREYNIQVVKPSFDVINSIVLDTNVTEDKLVYDFQPGNYQWRIKAKNGGSETKYVTMNFSVDSTQNLSNQIVSLISPANGSFTKSKSIVLKWNKVSYADDYRVEILTSSNSTLFVNASVTGDVLSYTFENEGTYRWKVRAQNASSVSAFSTANEITIDATTPGVPTGLTVTKSVSIPRNFTFNWTRAADSGTELKDSVYIYDNAATITPIKQKLASTASHIDSVSIDGTYYWRVKTFDKVGNISGFSATNTFTIP